MQKVILGLALLALCCVPINSKSLPDVSDKLDLEWNRGQQSKAVFAFRSSVQNLSFVTNQTIDRLNALVAGTTFSGVDQEIKTEGQEILNAIEQLQTFFVQHDEFINWEQPQ